MPEGLHHGTHIVHNNQEGGIRRGAWHEGRGTNESTSPFYRFAAMERILIIEVAGEQCTPRQRAVLILRYDIGLTFSEIAGALGISLAAAMQLHKRALLKLRRSLARMGIDGIKDLL